ncbi:MAG: hypothetical protein SGI84_12595, partial [Gemmatimonadota bacterium]|nr:hypothetical protein [Gemmatimonadota bacterium]
AAAELAKLASELQGLVQQFKIGDMATAQSVRVAGIPEAGGAPAGARRVTGARGWAGASSTGGRLAGRATTRERS